MNIQLQQPDDNDIEFMKKMLYEAVFWRPNPNKPSFEDGIALDGVHEAIDDWGKEHDNAVIALVDGKRIGAAWFRSYTDKSNIRGYINPETPALVIAVDSNYRQQGIAKQMMIRLLQQYEGTDVNTVSLCVSKDNHALFLYQSVGFKKVEDIGDSLIMIYHI